MLRDMRRPIGAVLQRMALVLAVLVAAGCSDDPPEAGRLPGDSPSPSSSSASRTPGTPEEQIEATMRAYFAAFNEAFKTGDVSHLTAFSVDGCPCRDSAERIERTHQSGGRYEGAAYKIESIKVHDIAGRSALAEVIATVGPYKIYNGDGEVTEDSQGGRLHTDYSLVQQESGNWVIGNSLDLE
jgi:hypothetical protein